jgi:hypothetical protein
MSSSASNRLNHPPLFLTKIWFYFFIFTATNALLAYAPFTLETKLWIGLIGFLLPFVLRVRALSSRTGKENTILKLELFETIPSWVWWGVLCLGLALRLIPLLNSSWIIPDEGLYCQLSVELHKKWEWLFLSSSAQTPPFFNWLLALYYHLLPPSVLTTRFFIFLLGILILILSLLTSRLFFSKSASLLYLIFFSVGFWPLFFCKFCLFMQPVFLVQMMTFYLLGLFLGSSSTNKSIAFGFGLGLVTGMGLWVSIPWPLMIPMVGIAIIPKLFQERISVCASTIFGLLLFLVPFLLLSWIEQNGQYVKFLWSFYRHVDMAESLKNLFSNWTVLFWEGNPDYAYQPIWGGILNPIEGAFCYLGIIEFVRSRRLAVSRWMLTSAFVFIIPGLLTNGFEVFHNILLAPILLVFCVCGALGLLAAIPASWRTPSLAAMVLVSSSLNLIHLEKTFVPLSFENSNRDPEYRQVRRIFSILDQTYRQNGAGLVFWDLSSFREYTMEFETFPFNAADNPRIRSNDVRWAAILCNANYRPFLEQRLPDSKWHKIGPDHYWNEGDLILAIISFQGPNRAILLRWVEANSRLHSITREYLFDHNGSHTNEIRQKLLGMETGMTNDPYLMSIFWERIIVDSGNGSSPDQWISWLDQAIHKGYPAAHLLTVKGLLLKSRGKQREAREAFRQAVRSPLNLTKASEYLQAMDSR